MNGDDSPHVDHMEELLNLLAQPDLSMYEAEQVLARLQPSPKMSRKRIVDRLLTVIEGAEHTQAREPDHVAEPRIATHDAALILLTYLGDETVLPHLLALIDKRALPDDFKLKLISVVHEFDPEIEPEELLSHLRNPFKAVRESHREHLQRLRSPVELGLWLDVMGNEMLPEARASFAQTSAEVDEPLAVPLLICLCYDDDAEVALAALDAVERYKDARALPALEELAQRHPNEAVRNEAGKAADRLRIRASFSPQIEPVPPPVLHLCYLTTIDGTGRQGALLARRKRPGTLRVVQTMFADETGIEYCFGMDIASGDLDDVLDELVELGMSPVDVPYAEFSRALDMACEATWNAGRSLPGSFVAWRDWLLWEWTHAAQANDRVNNRPEPADQDTLLSALSERERRQLLHDCPELLFQDEFTHWLFDEDEVDDLEECFWELVETRHGQAPEVSAVRSLLRQAVRRIVTDRVRVLIRDRLRRVAPLLRHLYVEDEVWQWAIVAADALADDSPLPPEEHPLLLAMAAHSLENVVGAQVKWRSASE
jgi:hypothetical protein